MVLKKLLKWTLVSVVAATTTMVVATVVIYETYRDADRA